MDEVKKKEILKKAKALFRNEISESHLKNLIKLVRLSKFNYNPFLIKYLSNFAFNNTEPESLAKALIYPRTLGTSITTIFGNNMQKRFITSVLEGFGSTTRGIDIEFIDQTDGRKKYCQIKSGPNTLNKDDVDTISDHFVEVRRLARTNSASSNVGIEDLIVGVLYGTPEELSGNYKKISRTYPVYVGKDFWYRLTGDELFYADLIQAIGELAEEINGKKALSDTVKKLAEDIKVKISKGDL